MIIRCEDCPKISNDACLNCLYLIDGGTLRKKLDITRKVIIEGPDGKKYAGELFMISPVGLGIKSQVPLGQYYYVYLMNELKAKIKMIGTRGKDDYYGFDVIEVVRKDGTSQKLNNDEFLALTASCDQLVDDISEHLPENVRTIVQERLKTELIKAKILDLLQVGQTLKFERGIVKPITTGKVKLPMNELTAIANECSNKMTHCREVIIDENDNMFDVHAIPFNYQSGGLLILDVTPIIQKERELKEKEKLIYREVITAVTGGRLLLVSKEEIAIYMAVGKNVIEESLKEPGELDIIREKIKVILDKLNTTPKVSLLFLICVSEALTNTLKHANEGTCRLNILPEGMIRVEVTDNGPGINFKDLPKATLMKSFSTQKSLGCGFTIMLQYMDKVVLSTDSSGTRVVLEKRII